MLHSCCFTGDFAVVCFFFSGIYFFFRFSACVLLLLLLCLLLWGCETNKQTSGTPHISHCVPQFHSRVATRPPNASGHAAPRFAHTH